MYCNNNPIMYVDEEGTIAGWVIGIAVVLDTIFEISILMNDNVYNADNVFAEENVHIPNSAMFNNPIAQYIYSKYLYKNVKNEDGTNFFTGDVYDIIGEWQAHNFAALVIDSIIITCPISYFFLKDYHNRSFHADIGSSVEEEDGFLVRTASQIFKWINKISTLDFLNWW